MFDIGELGGVAKLWEPKWNGVILAYFNESERVKIYKRLSLWPLIWIKNLGD